MGHFSGIYEVRTLEGVIVPMEDWPVSRALRGETFSGVELIGKRLDTGREWILSFSGAPVFEPSGAQVLAVSVARDVTEARRIAKALTESESRYRRLLESCPVGLALGGIVGERRGTLSVVNDAFLKIIGYSREEFDAGSVRCDRISPPEFEAADTEAIRQLLDGVPSKLCETEFIRKDGSRVPV